MCGYGWLVWSGQVVCSLGDREAAAGCSREFVHLGLFLGRRWGGYFWGWLVLLVRVFGGAGEVGTGRPNPLDLN